ncbi:TonB-dependent receptor plug domain-containing protein [Poritiphilus flavus]|uniref:TonB-dependent receptor plug domain-containing protein n=1 Tax=Poritiphilus flavus TaxID=2697053 RepID=A0A6L9EDK6_9FLAO|nr:TonB-dependent receptor plug domain-containing protein [Poritiphilus flavus]NAS12712.1 hypothetical protein [Poritiphilus flavus]
MKKKVSRLFRFALLFLIIFGFQAPQQENRVFDLLLSKLSIYAGKENPEKIHVHTDKEYYTRGETLWFKAYILNGITHRPSDKSKVVYVELLDENNYVVADRRIFVDDTSGAGDIDIGDNIKQGKYRLRAYTRYMLNKQKPLYFEKEIPIWAREFGLSDSSEEPEEAVKNGMSSLELTDSITPGSGRVQQIRFYPEGGDLVSGLLNKVGIKVTNGLGKGEAVSGVVTDDNGDFVTNFRSYESGLGSFSFIPKPDRTYFASIMAEGNEKKFSLPEASLNGYVLSVENNTDHLILKVKATSPNSLEGTLLLGHLRGELFYKHIGKPKEEDGYALMLPTSKLKDGVAHFTLFTSSGEPVCERLVFIDPSDNDALLDVKFDKNRYKKRDKVTLDLRLKDRDDNGLEGNLSMSIVKQAYPTADAVPVADIKSWLLLNSDLGDTVENPDYFFKDNSIVRKRQLDLLMLTHGWRRFVWKDFLQNGVNKALKYQPEKGIMVTGKTTELNNSFKSRVTNITLGFLGQESYYDTKVTDVSGRFSFGPFAFNDSISVVLDATTSSKKRKTDSKQVSIIVDSELPRLITKEKRISRWTQSALMQARHNFNNIFSEEFSYDPGVVQLEEAVITQKKKKIAEQIEEELNSLTPYGKPSNRIIRDSVLGHESLSLMDMLIMMPGVQIKGNFPGQTIKIRGGVHSIQVSPEPLILMDGVKIPTSVIQQMDSFSVLFIDLLVGADAAFFGVRGANGVIAIYTDRGSRYNFTQQRSPGITSFVMPGFYKTREFYAPDYSIPKPEHSKADYRHTLHWEPVIPVKDGKYDPISFYTDDSSGNYRVTVEGVTSDGRVIHKTDIFHVD